MSASRRRNGRDKPPRHVRLHHWVMDTPAWKSLNTASRALYLEIAARYMGSNNGRIPYSQREAAEALHIGKTTALEAFNELQSRGFIVAQRRGSFDWKRRHSTEWRLTEFGCDVTGDLATKDFARWCQEEKVRVLRATRTGPDRDPIGISARPDLSEKTRYGT
jgi:DNA-binding transcriptional MocR family regulator